MLFDIISLQGLYYTKAFMLLILLSEGTMYVIFFRLVPDPSRYPAPISSNINLVTQTI